MILLTNAQARAVAQWLKRMSGQCAAPFGMPLDYVRFIQRSGLAVFQDAADGRWHVTESGWAFYRAQTGEGPHAWA